MYISWFRAKRWHAYTRVHVWACETMAMETWDHASPPPHGFAVPSDSRGWSNSSSWTVLLFQTHTTFVQFQSQESHRKVQRRAPSPDLGSVHAICGLLIADLLFIFLKRLLFISHVFPKDKCVFNPFLFLQKGMLSDSLLPRLRFSPFTELHRPHGFLTVEWRPLFFPWMHSTSQCGCTRAHTANPAHGRLDWLQASGITLAIRTHRPVYCWEVGFWGQRKHIDGYTKI